MVSVYFQVMGDKKEGSECLQSCLVLVCIGVITGVLGKRELICLLSFTCNYVVFVWRGFLFLWVLGMGYVILLWHSLSLPYNYFGRNYSEFT